MSASAAGGSKSPSPASPASAVEVPAEERPIEVDIDGEDGDSAINVDDLSSLTASITSSVVNYPIEHGRRYHAFRSGVYPLPNDDLEQDRLDLMHLVLTKLIGDKLFLAPINPDNVHRVLDIGTGTGIWTMSFGDEYPQAQVLGNDLSPIQPPWVPPNVKFEVDDVEEPWVYSAPFDFIFCRYMLACIQDWPKLVRNAYNNLTPGGWVEFQDFDVQYYSEDGTLPEDSAMYRWITKLVEICNKIGRDPRPGRSLEKWVRDAGFENVEHHRFRLPIGGWPKDPELKKLGQYNLAQVLSGLEGFSLRLFCTIEGWSQEELLVLLAQVRQEMKNPKIHVQYDYHVVYGQKPAAK